MIYIPKGGMCRVCTRVSKNCSGYDFSKMQSIKREDDKGRVIVKCHWFSKAEAKPAKPAKAPVDLSVLIDSGIDCCFSDSWLSGDGEANSDVYSKLYSITRQGKYRRSDTLTFHHCTPRMNYWFSSRQFGGSNPAYALIVRLREAGFRVESSYFNEEYMTEFRITGINSNRCWPWECG